MARYGTFECGRDKCATIHDETGDTFDHSFVAPASPTENARAGTDDDANDPPEAVAIWKKWDELIDGGDHTEAECIRGAVREA